MEAIAGLVLSLVALVLLALVGTMAVAGLSLMAILGLLSNMSFKRLFFVSFGMALFAPVLLGALVYSELQDGSLQRELQEDLGNVAFIPSENFGNWRENLDEMREIGREVERGNLSEEEAEQRIKQIFTGSDGTQLELEGLEVVADGDAVQIQID